MATKSFLKNVNIKTRKQARLFINALEKAEKSHEQKNISYDRHVYEVKNEQINEFLKKVRCSN